MEVYRVKGVTTHRGRSMISMIVLLKILSPAWSDQLMTWSADDVVVPRSPTGKWHFADSSVRTGVDSGKPVRTACDGYAEVSLASEGPQVFAAFSSRRFAPFQLVVTCSLQPPKSRQSDVESFGRQWPYVCMSSAHWYTNRARRSTLLTMSAVYIMNRIGPRRPPEARQTRRWTTLTAPRGDIHAVDADSWSKYERNRDKTAPFRPKETLARRRRNRIVCSSVSNAADKSGKARVAISPE